MMLSILAIGMLLPVSSGFTQNSDTAKQISFVFDSYPSQEALDIMFDGGPHGYTEAVPVNITVPDKISLTPLQNHA